MLRDYRYGALASQRLFFKQQGVASEGELNLFATVLKSVFCALYASINAFTKNWMW